jgi:putative ABC transport system permease protein
MRRLFRLPLRNRAAIHTDADDELQALIASRVEHLLARGMSPEDARAEALRRLGVPLEDARQELRGSARRREGRLHIAEFIDGVAQEIRYVARTLVRTPGFAGVVALTLALGIGANTAIFSVIRGVLLRPLPNRDGDRLVYLRQTAEGREGAYNTNFSVAELRDLRTGVPALGSGIAEYSPYGVVLQSNGDATRLNAGLVTGNYFEVMGLSPLLGRLTRPSDDGPGVPPVVVLTSDFWQRRFGGDSGIVGQPLIMDGRAVTVIGVLQPAPFFPLQMDVLMNMVISPHHIGAAMQNIRAHRMTEAVARLAPGATLAQAVTQVATVSARMQREFPDAYDPRDGFRVSVIPFKRAMGERARLTLWLLMSTAAFVLIIAAASVANLTLMRNVRREHELAVRASLGAGVGRLRRLLLVENLMISVVGAVLGLGVAVGGLPLLVSLTRRYSPRADEIHLDAMVLGFALALAVAVALLLSLVAYLPSEHTLASVSAGGWRATGGVRKQRLQRGLVVVQVAATVMLLAGAGLLTRTTMRLADVPTGLETERVITMSANLFGANRTQPDADVLTRQHYDRIRDDIAALPGVHRVGVGSVLPLRAPSFLSDITVEGRPLAPGETAPDGAMCLANPDFFAAAGIPLLAGRPFATTDHDSAPKVAILNQLLARRLFPGEDPIGRRIRVATMTGMFSGDWRTIVGVVGNTEAGGPEGAPAPTIYVPFAQEPPLTGGFVIRADTTFTGIATAAERIVRRAEPTIPVEDVMTIAQFQDQTVAPRRINAALVSSFGFLAVVIAAVGIAGVLAFGVSARTNEIGIRMSLGAQRGTVERMILAEGGRLVGLGVVLGTAGAYASSGVIRGLLFGVTPHDPVTFGLVVVTMVVIGLAACWLPASRAARIDPAITLRST